MLMRLYPIKDGIHFSVKDKSLSLQNSYLKVFCPQFPEALSTETQHSTTSLLKEVFGLLLNLKG